MSNRLGEGENGRNGKRGERREERAKDNGRKGKEESQRKGEREECTVKSGRLNIFLIDEECINEKLL